jgi:hypothetical protein
VAANWTVQGGELNVVLVFSWAVRQEYVVWVGIDLLPVLLSALLEVNDQLHASTDLLPLSKLCSSLTIGQ